MSNHRRNILARAFQIFSVILFLAFFLVPFIVAENDKSNASNKTNSSNADIDSDSDIADKFVPYHI